MSDDFMLNEFKVEAEEMFEEAIDGLLAIEKGEDFSTYYNSIFRAFHSLKGAAGMFGIEDLQSHMHKLESLFEKQKDKGSLQKSQVDYLLAGIDAAKMLLNGDSVSFEHLSLEEFEGGESKKEVKKEIKKEQVEDVKAVKKAESPPKAKNSKSKDRKAKVVVVDDEAEICKILEFILTEDGYDVITFTSPTDLFEKVDLDKVDIILSDLSMPEMSGLDLTKKVSERKKDLPIIIISAHVDKPSLLKLLEYGVFGVIEKPFNENFVLTLCRNAVERYRALKVLSRSIDYILYQFSDLDNYLKGQGKEMLRVTLKEELNSILEQRKLLKTLK